MVGNWREWVDEWGTQFRAHLRLIVLLVALVAVSGMLLVYIDLQTSIHPTALVQDPAFVAQLPSYTGAISTSGILIWGAAATVSIFSGVLLWNTPGCKERSRFLIHMGLITVALTIDDQFLIHEAIAARVGSALGAANSAQGIELLETGIYLAYFGWLLFIALKYLGMIRASAHLLLALGLAGFAASLAVDAVPSSSVSAVLAGETSEGVEELLKLGGILFWSAYLIHTGYASVRARLRQP